jgi:AraC-like DNA-binding protein
MNAYPLTRVGTIGPIADMIESSGGSVARVFRASELPLRLIDQPDCLILLSDQFRLLESAARDIGDDALSARLAMAAGLAGLGPYGRLFMSFDCLGAAITAAYRNFAQLLQASTHMDLAVSGRRARWSYRITASMTVGRQKNELLALGYMLQMLRRFAGSDWTPERIELPGRLEGRRGIEDVFAGNLVPGENAAIIFPADLLELPNLAPARWAEPAEIVPHGSEFPRVVTHMIRLGLLARRPGIDQTARRLGLARRTLQRRLAARECNYDDLMQDVILAEACKLLRHSDRSVTDIAFELGYSDLAHFSRAFRRWTGAAPREWRLQETAKSMS